MDGGRQPLPIGTRIKLEHGSLYQITGEPIGYGGFSILYPVQKLIVEEGLEQLTGIPYALKECFPAPTFHSFCRGMDGSVVPEVPEQEAWEYLYRIQNDLIQESLVSHSVFPKAHHILAIHDSAKKITLTQPEQSPCDLENTFIVMESLHQKGAPLRELLEEYRCFKPVEAFRILQQLLFALREIHNASFLHLDITDSNVFIRGTLDDDSNMLTLMDLGCAWPLSKTDPQKTDYIDPDKIFLSNGFCPPEASRSSCLQLEMMGIELPRSSVNENGIRLGMDADLYQAACLLRYMLTGDRKSSADLLICRRNQYLRPFEVPELKCSDSIIENIQLLLTKALEPNPDARYHSADEMLEDVSGILKELKRKPKDLSTTKYAAFICYKHGPKDSVVARKLQQMLEHYHPPKIKDKIIPQKPFHRVFVDEGELSCCEDMGKEINHALKNSAHLIVICSEDTPKSHWVEQEILAFRESHKNDPNARILAVLTGGTPSTSYPAALTADGREPEKQYSPQVQSRYAWLSVQKLRNGNLLKLVAPMLSNVDLEDLVQRRKMYVRRRNTIAAVCLCIAAAISISRSVLIARQAARIEEEHAAAQRNTALYLTEQARRHLEDNDRLGALELLLDAFPEKDQNYDAPTQTEYWLSKALDAYVSPYWSEERYTDTGKIQAAHTNFFLDPTGNYLFSWHVASETMDIWNTGTMAPQWTVNIPLVTLVQHLQRTIPYDSLPVLLTSRQYACETSADFLLPDNQTLIVRGRGSVTGVNYVAGTNRWSTPIDYVTAMAINESKTHLVVLSETDENTAALNAHILDAETGQIQRSIPLCIDPDWIVSAGMQISEDLTWAAIPVQEVNSESIYFPSHKIYLLNLETGDCRFLDLQKGQISSLRFLGGKLLLQHHNDYAFTMVEPNGVEISKLPDSIVSLEAYDPASGTRTWQQEQPCYSWNSYDQGILPVPYDTGTCSGQGALFYWDRFAILTDLETGEILHSYELPDGILEMKVGENFWCATLCNGTEATSSYDSKNLYVNRLVSGPLIGACSQNRVFYLQHPDESIIRYEENRFDENYTHQADLKGDSWQLYDVTVQGNGYELLLTAYNEVAIVHTEDQSVLYHNAPDLSSQPVLGLSENRQNLYWSYISSLFPPEILSLDLSTGAVSEYPLPLADQEVSWWDPVYLDGHIVYAAMRFTEGRQNELAIYSWVPGTDQPNVLYSTFLTGESDAVQWDTFLGDPENNTCFLAISEVDRLHPTQLLYLDVRHKKAMKIPVEFLPVLQNENLESTLLQESEWHPGGYCWSGNGKLAVFCFGDTAYGVDEKGSNVCQIPLKHNVISSRISPDGESLFLAEADGTISRWRLPDGMWMGSISLKEYCGTDSLEESRFHWEFRDGDELIIYTDTEAILLALSDGSLTVQACVERAQLLDMNDQFWVLENLHNEYTHIGTFPRYKAADLQQMAQEMLP